MITFLLALLFAGSITATPASDPSFSLQASDRCKNRPSWSSPTELERAICEIARTTDDRDAIAAQLSEAFDLCSQCARDLLSAIALRWRVEEDLEPAERDLRRLEQLLLDILLHSDGSPITAAELGHLYADVAPGRWLPSEDLATGFHRLSDPAATALEIFSAAVEGIDVLDRTEYARPTSEHLIFAAIAAAPEDPTLLLTGAAYTGDPAWKATLARRAYSVVSGSEMHAALQPVAAYLRVAGLLGAGLSDDAIRVFESLAADHRGALLRGTFSLPANLSTGSSPQPLALDLAAAAHVIGDTVSARKYFEQVPSRLLHQPGPTSPGTHADESAARERARDLQRRLIRQALHPDGDPFELVAAILKALDGYEIDPLPDATWMRSFLLLLVQEDYTGALSYVRERLGWMIAAPPEPGVFSCILSRDVCDAHDDTRLRMETVMASIESLEADEVPADPVTEMIDGSLRAPNLFPYTLEARDDAPEERSAAPMTSRPGAPEASLDGEIAAALQSVRQPSEVIPAGFRVLREVEEGSRAVAIGHSRAYDPVGELPTVGYWLRLTDLETGRRNYAHLGFRKHLPFVIVADSDLPLISGDQLRIEVREESLDPASISFPPVGLRMREGRRGLALTATIGAIVRDTDGDGLSDLEEDRLLTDPRDPDSDDDGYSDAIDPIPHVAFDPHSIDDLPTGIVVSKIASVALGDPESWPAPDLESKSTVFWIGDRSAFGGLWPDRRMIVLTQNELERYRAKFGVTFGHQPSVFLLNRAGDAGFVIWSQQWHGGIFRLERAAGGEWTVRITSEWIT